jgi:anti-sigma regulatory factor (Ser/Thr protein kinase)
VARAHLRAAISSWRLPVDVDVAVLLVSELVTNAVTHGDGGAGATAEVTMLVRHCGGQLRVEVHDRSPDMPAPVWPQAPEDSETGRGLLLVDALAGEWGCYWTPGGKAVYFTLPLRDHPPDRPAGVTLPLLGSPPARPSWRKSSLSLYDGACVEVAGLPGGQVGVRSSRDCGGPVLAFTPAEWHAFIGGVRNGEFDCFGEAAG